MTARPAAGSGAPTQWREVEVELISGSQSLLDAADKLLRQAGLSRSRRSAKLERLLVSSLPAPAAMATGPQAIAADVVTAYLREHAPAPRERLKALHDWVADRVAYDGPAATGPE